MWAGMECRKEGFQICDLSNGQMAELLMDGEDRRKSTCWGTWSSFSLHMMGVNPGGCPEGCAQQYWSPKRVCPQ
jgi:hypothetical protein